MITNRDLDHKLNQVIALLQQLLKGEKRIMATVEQANAALKSIDDATNAQATSLQTISDNLDKLIADAKAAGVADSVLAGMQAEADKLTAQAEFSKALASKGVDNPVPVPPPAP